MNTITKKVRRWVKVRWVRWNPFCRLRLIDHRLTYIEDKIDHLQAVRNRLDNIEQVVDRQVQNSDARMDELSEAIRVNMSETQSRFKAFADEYATTEQVKYYVDKSENWSDAVETMAIDAVREAVENLDYSELASECVEHLDMAEMVNDEIDYAQIMQEVKDRLTVNVEIECE